MVILFLLRSKLQKNFPSLSVWLAASRPINEEHCGLANHAAGFGISLHCRACHQIGGQLLSKEAAKRWMVAQLERKG